MKPAKDVFDIPSLSFPGSPTDQAQFLLRTVRPLGNVDSKLATLPAALKSALAGTLAKPSGLKTALRKLITGAGLNENIELGGSLDKPLSKAGTQRAFYFVIHDTSTAMAKGKPFPVDMDKASWSGNDIKAPTKKADPVAHMFINRLGESRTGHDYGDAHGSTKLETKSKGLGTKLVGRFIHNELVQPRVLNKKGLDEFAPDPGFSTPQLERLALLYVCASVRADQWLVPAYHCVLDEGIPDGHDDPQKFSLDDWSKAIGDLVGKLVPAGGGS
jgi:hypothetical protein